MVWRIDTLIANSIAGKVVVITGASSGLGEATARLLSAQGASVALGARCVDRLKSLADELTKGDGKALTVATDVTNSDHVKQLVDAAVQTFGRIGVLTISPRGGRNGTTEQHQFQDVVENIRHPLEDILPLIDEHEEKEDCGTPSFHENKKSLRINDSIVSM